MELFLAAGIKLYNFTCHMGMGSMNLEVFKFLRVSNVSEWIASETLR